MLFTWGLLFLALVARGAAQDDADTSIGAEANRYIVEFAKASNGLFSPRKIPQLTKIRVRWQKPSAKNSWRPRRG